MSKGIKGAIASLALLGLGVFLCASPAAAQLAVSGSTADTDDLAPSPVGAVQAEFNEGGRSITVTWPLSDDDGVRQVPTSSDFTTGGTFREVNDVAGYNIWRRLADGSGSLAIVGTVGTGVTSLVDASIDVSAGSRRYVYMVSVVDESGNESAPIESAEVKNMLLFGDFDYDGDVDLLDYGIFQANFGKADFYPATDMDGNGMVDLEDFFLWADNLGADLYE
ncbi:MAG: hypothetical protein OXH81_25670 [Gemmatimonadetes bacterium]|nr:hypothetical protein [Gemmatimonadota bacterium]MCY3788748.1 hypothetical protein [Gemmatimonadota bacterium]MDE2733889.1 hypothetical protein [Gemmatimonadota bacterium]